MEYIIVRVDWPSGSSKLAKKVQEKIEEGYTPIGGVSTWEDKLCGRVFIQSMTKENNNGEPD